MNFISVCENVDGEAVEVPVEEDGTVLFTTLLGQFPRICGLKYRPLGSATFRALKLLDGRLYGPVEGWVGQIFVCIFGKETDNKRKCEDNDNEDVPKPKKMEGRKCTDLIVLNIGWNVDEDCLRKYFSPFGDLVLVQVKRDRDSGNSRGYAFIRYSDYKSQALCLAEEHLINGRWCSVKVPFSKNEADKQEVSKKVHVAYTSEEITMDDLRNSFKEYGYVTDIFIPKPFRNFAFVTFDTGECAQSLVGKTISVKGHSLSIGNAVPKVNNRMQELPQFQTYPNNGQSFIPKFGWPNSNNALQNSYMSGQIRPPNYGNHAGRPFSSHQQFPQSNNRSNMVPKSFAPSPQDMGQNTAAMAALNILNNPNVVAAIVAAANKTGPNSHTNSYQNGNIQ